MSAVLRLGGIQAHVPLAKMLYVFLMPLAPRLPSISLLLPQWPLLSKPAVAESRLQELEELLEKQDDLPFMFDNGSILKAAPKKKPSYKRTREKRLSPGDKQIQPLENLVRCAACGRVKRSHFMCMHCLGEIRAFLKEKKKQLFGEPTSYNPNIDPVDKRIVFPYRRSTDIELMYKEKAFVSVRETPLEYFPKEVKKQ